jgi:protein TIF31
MHDMVSRGAKHVFSVYLRRIPLLEVPACISHLLNCLVGYKLNPCPHPQTCDDEDISQAPTPAWAKFNSKRLQNGIANEIYVRYRFDLLDDWWNECKPFVLLREICLKMGFQLKAREYKFEKSDPVTNDSKPKKSANGANGQGQEEETTFYPEDILNVVPVIKEAPLKVATS